MYETFCENCSHFILKWFQPNSFGRASNSPALRGSLPPGPYFSRSAAKRVKSPASMKKSSQACKISRISGEKIFTLQIYFANFHWQGGMQPQKIIMIINILISLGEIKHFVAQQMQNCLWQNHYIYILIQLSRAWNSAFLGRKMQNFLRQGGMQPQKIINNVI